jgi:hypothetical protein
MRSMLKRASSASYSLSGIGHPSHRRGCVSELVFDLLSWSSLQIFLR